MQHCVFQKGFNIFGVGFTQKEAIDEAKLWINEQRNSGSVILVPYWEAADGDMVLLRCTDRLYRHVVDFGGESVSYHVCVSSSGEPIVDIDNVNY